MILQCVKCTSRLEVDADLLSKTFHQMECPSCHQIFRFEVPSDKKSSLQRENQVTPPIEPTEEILKKNAEGESAVLAVEDFHKGPQWIDQKKRTPRQFEKKRASWKRSVMGWSLVLLFSLALGGGTYWLNRKGHQQTTLKKKEEKKLLSPIVSFTPTATPTEEPPLKLSDELKVKPKAKYKPSDKPVRKAILIEKLKKEYAKQTPSAFKNLRPKLVKAAKPYKSILPKELALMLVDVYAYLGNRQQNKKWIVYAYETAHHFQTRYPQDARGKRLKATALLAAGQAQKARPFAKESFQANQGDPLAWICLAKTQFGTPQGPIKGGIQHLEKALEKFPLSFFIQEALAEKYLQVKDAEKTEPLVRKLLEQEPEDLHIAHLAVQTFEAQKKWAEVILVLDPLSKYSMPDKKFFLSLSQAYSQTGQLDKVKQVLGNLLSSKTIKLSSKEEAEIRIKQGKVEFDQTKAKAHLNKLKEPSTKDNNQ